jgi:ABC-type Na+ transport system ATPase subunit NatA
MKQILLIKDKGEEEAIIDKLIEVNSKLLKVYIISTSLPLIANLSAIENIVLPASFHRLGRLKNLMEKGLNYLAIYNLSDKVHARNNDLDEYQRIKVKYISSLVSGVHYRVFVSLFNAIDVNKREEFINFLKNCDENYLIIEYNQLYDHYKEIDGLIQVEFDKWLTQDLKV